MCNMQPTFQIFIANVDITDLVIARPMEIQSSSDFPYLSDTEIGNITFTVFSEDSDFDPLQSNNFFERHWNRPDKMIAGVSKDPSEYDKTGYKAPVYIVSDDTVIFNGIIIDILPDLSTESATITASDVSKDLREAELDTELFGLERYLLGNADGVSAREFKYLLPTTAAPVYPKSVVVTDLSKVDVLHTEGVANSQDYMVDPQTPAIETSQELTRSPKIRFRESYRWRRVDALVNAIFDAVVEDDDFDKSVSVSPITSASAVFATRGRVGWHTEGGSNYQSAPPWGYTGFVRDFVVDPDTGDAFFLYGSTRYSNAIIHYDYSEDTYTKYPFSISGVTGIRTLWRIATADFENFYVLGTTPETDAVLKVPERGNNYNAASGVANSQPPAVYHFVKSTEVWREVTGYTNAQLANYTWVGDTSSDNRNWYADTCRLFHAWTQGSIKYLAYIVQSSSAYGVRIWNLNSNSLVQNFDVSDATATGLGADFAVDDTHLYGVRILASGQIQILKSTTGYSGGSFQNVGASANNDPNSNTYTPVTDSNYLNVTSLVKHSTGLYGVLQFKRPNQSFAGSKLVRFTESGGTWTLALIKEYDYYIFGARGGVANSQGVFYFEGSRFQYEYSSVKHVNAQGKRLDPPTGRLIEVSSGAVKDHGLVWRSALLPNIDGDRHYDFGAHGAAIPPLRAEGERIHILAGYGNVPASIKSSPSIADDLDDAPSDRIENWQWITYGTNQPLYLERFAVAEKEKAWDALKRLALLTYARLRFSHDFKTYTGVSPNQTPDIDGGAKSTLHFEPRPDTPGQTITLDKTFADYGINDTILTVDARPTYTQIYNQIRGNVTYTVKNLVPTAIDAREVLSENAASMAFMGVNPLAIEMSLLTHHQLWWAKRLGDRYLKALEKPQQDIRIRAIWSPDLKVGSFIELDVKKPPDYTEETVLRVANSQATVIEITHNVSADAEGAWTTDIIARTFPTPPTERGTFAGEDQTPPAVRLPDATVSDLGKWSGVAISQATGSHPLLLVLSDSGDAAHFFGSRSGQTHTYKKTLGTGRWVDVAATPALVLPAAPREYLILKATATAGEVWKLTVTASDASNIIADTAIATFNPTLTKVITLPAGNYVAITMSASHIYVLNQEDWQIYAYDSSTYTRGADRALSLIGNYTSMAMLSGTLYVLVEDAGILITLPDPQGVHSTEALIQGVVDWVGVDAIGSDFYTIRKNATRVLAWTPGRDSDNDFEDLQ